MAIGETNRFGMEYFMGNEVRADRGNRSFSIPFHRGSKRGKQTPANRIDPTVPEARGQSQSGARRDYML